MSVYDEMADMIEILDDFIVETNELIEQLDQDLLLLESGADEDLINRTFRAFHTIKGTSGFLGLNVCMDLAHVAEDLLNQIRNREREPNPLIIDALLGSVDWFKGFLDDLEQREDKQWDASASMATIQKILDGTAEAPATAASAEVAQDDPARIVQITAPPELLEEFVSESRELLETLSNDILSLEIEPENSDLINQIFRVFHTIKGNSGLVGLQDMSIVAHKAEDVLGQIREKKLKPETFAVDTLLLALDYLRGVVEEAASGQVQQRTIKALQADLERVLNGDIPTEEEEPAIDTTPATEGEHTMEASEPAEPAGPGSEPSPVADPPKKTAAAPKAATRSPNPKRPEQTIRVDVHRLDNLMNLVGELVLEKNRLNQVSNNAQGLLVGHPSASDLEGLNNSLGYITSEIQESVMQMRMLPIVNVFRKFPRLIRDLAREKGKEMRLVIEGEDTELDRSVIEAIGDPMVHLLRNAADHGIEAPEIRRTAGKPVEGTIKLSAYQEGNQIVIEIQDDGAGIDPEKIMKKALERKLITQEEAERLSSREIVQLIFKPGFSTAEKITDVSGRGVGMDVVNSNISKLNGTVEITTAKGLGSTFIIKLPLTLTIMTGMVVRVHDEHYIIPLINISETLRLEEQRISSVKGQRVLSLRNTVIPILYVEELLNVPRPDVADEEEHYIVIVDIAEKQLGLIVSRLLGQEETVVKPLGKILGKLPYFAGATLRGDGHVCLIMDIPSIIENGLLSGAAA